MSDHIILSDRDTEKRIRNISYLKENHFKHAKGYEILNIYLDRNGFIIFGTYKLINNVTTNVWSLHLTGRYKMV